MNALKISHLRPATDLAEIKIARRAAAPNPYDDGTISIQHHTSVIDPLGAVEEIQKPEGSDAQDRAGPAPILSALIMQGPEPHDDHKSGTGFDLDRSGSPAHATVAPLADPATSAEQGPAALASGANQAPVGLQPYATASGAVGLFESSVQHDPGQADGAVVPLGPGDFDIVPPPPTHHIGADNLHELLDHLNRHGEGELTQWSANDLDGGTTLRVGFPQSWDQIPEELRILRRHRHADHRIPERPRFPRRHASGTRRAGGADLG